MRNAKRVIGLARSNRRVFVSLASAFAVVLFLVLGTGQFQAIFSRDRYDDFVVGAPAPRDLFADRTVTYVDEEATRLRKEAISRLVPPVYVVNSEIAARNLEEFDEFAAILLAQRSQARNIEAMHLELQAKLPIVVPRTLVELLWQAGNLPIVVSEARERLEEIYAVGVVDPIPSGNPTVSVAVETLDENGATVIANTTIDRLFEIGITDSYERHFPSTELPNDLGRAVRESVDSFLQTNTFFDAKKSAESREQAVRAIEPVVIKIVKGERIVQQGLIVSNSDRAKLEVLSNYSITRSSSKSAGTVLLVLGIFLLALVLFTGESASEGLDERQIHLLCGIFATYGLFLFVAVRFVTLPTYVFPSVILPSALATMIVTILIRPRAAIHLAFLQGLLVLVATDFDAYSSLFALASGVSGTLVVRGARKRLDLIRASLLLAIMHGVALVTLGIYRVDTLSHVIAIAGWGIASGIITAILNLGVLPFLEHALNAATPFRLIELSDLNAPILKKMLTLAPGTYGHTVMVANLAESACGEIGANPLLARVGAYYHDIGKIEQADYFVENQTGDNKHDELKPSLSVAVIKSHVKIGIEKAKELGLPREVVDIVAQHHGSQLIHYFYAQAVKSDNVENVSRKDFSYGGTPPVSKEAAVVMLADGVEAASRTLKKPSVAKLEKFVWKTMLDKFSSEQMSHCDLTFRDLDTIKKSFVHILAGQFHSRIEYPEMEEENGRSLGAG